MNLYSTDEIELLEKGYMSADESYWHLWPIIQGLYGIPSNKTLFKKEWAFVIDVPFIEVPLYLHRRYFSALDRWRLRIGK